MTKTTSGHHCDTDNPTRPCCWQARDAEFAILKANDDARLAKYGSLRCPACHKTYRVTDGVVEDHSGMRPPSPSARPNDVPVPVCSPLSADQILGL